MKFISYLENKIFYILFQLTMVITISFFMTAASIPFFHVLLIIIISLISLIFYLIIDYLILKKKYHQIVDLVDGLDEKYLISEIIPKSLNLENKAYIYALKKACKSMTDKVSDLEKENLDYREYIESFVHEIKTPISALALILDENKDSVSKKELDKIDLYIDQMLYYARSENPEKDYFVKKVKLSEVIHKVVIRYKQYLLDKKVTLNVDNLDYDVFADEKWTVFIISQILQNSIKYADKKKKYIDIKAIEAQNNITLFIFDNGCGIKESDLPRVFEKGFTGSNRNKKNATGIGLYLSKKIAKSLGLELQIESKENNYTKVYIVFPKSNIHNLID